MPIAVVIREVDCVNDSVQLFAVFSFEQIAAIVASVVRKQSFGGIRFWSMMGVHFEELVSIK